MLAVGLLRTCALAVVAAALLLSLPGVSVSTVDMDSALRALWTALLVFVAALHMATAQSISPTNATSGTALEQDGLEEAIEIGISQNEHAAPMAIFSVAGLTADSQRYTPVRETLCYEARFEAMLI